MTGWGLEDMLLKYRKANFCFQYDCFQTQYATAAGRFFKNISMHFSSLPPHEIELYFIDKIEE